jgi:HAD superfamily hydrolase (TIGR01458 family)
MMGELRGVIFDIDGTLEFQDRVIPGAMKVIEDLRQKGYTLKFLTNSTMHSRRSRAARLVKSGLVVSPKEIITASYATACYLRRLNPRSCWVMLEGEGLEEFPELSQDPLNPEYIVIGDNRSKFDFDHMNHALRLLLRGAKIIGMNPDLVDNNSGEPELNVGSWVKMLEVAAGVEAVYIGKPFPWIFELTLAGMGLNKEQVLMIGDRVQTDIRGAKEFGLRAALVKTGEYRPGDLNDIQPDIILDSLGDLVEIIMS